MKNDVTVTVSIICQDKKTNGKRWNMRHEYITDNRVPCTYPAKFKITIKKENRDRTKSWIDVKYVCGIHKKQYEGRKNVQIKRIDNVIQ